MTVSMYQAGVQPMIRSLNNLIGILEKGAAHAEAKKIDPEVLISFRLYPDMFPLSRQIQIASDISGRGTAKLAGVEAPVMEDNETSFPELIDRLKQTVTYLETFSPEQIDGTEEKTIELDMRGNTLTFDGQTFLLSFVLPNVYFHVTTAYNILRHCGVEIGKGDYLGAHNH
ncbi:DUF1993 family protein [Crocosphaera sp.]|uniref:DUF1993 domain-containing protein n=1 Tax=Crocosphaera sp. TaxID=2729996 RepID=UPI002601FBA2|nr:DUF1993 domain-containing protein [Crocosphaera sp.]MDJ0578796.1 DUF1993 domain-containing protein [Crocosphaera sp.]